MFTSRIYTAVVNKHMSQPSSSNVERNGVDTTYLTEWEHFYIGNGNLFRKYIRNGEEFRQKVLPSEQTVTPFRAYNDELGHQG